MKEFGAVAIDPELMRERDQANAAADKAITTVAAKEKALKGAEGWLDMYRKTKQEANRQADRDRAAKALEEAEEARDAAVDVSRS